MAARSQYNVGGLAMTESPIYRAHTNIALIKYWGKRNETLFLPVTSSLSLTLDQFYTETRIAWHEEAEHDLFILDNQPQDATNITRFVNLFRSETGINTPVRVESYNYVPTAAGLASSASGYAALACACNHLFNTGYSPQILSTYARQGSGSATRSLFGGFVKWQAGQGDDSASSYAYPVDDASWDIGMVVVIVNQAQKSISSRQGMEHTINTSPFYKLWPDVVNSDLAIIESAIASRNFTQLGEVTEHNAMEMHALMLSSKPSYTYFESDSLIAMQAVRELRRQGIEAYFTMDAGPNVKILCRLSQAEMIKQQLLNYFTEEQLVVTGPGPGPHIVN